MQMNLVECLFIKGPFSLPIILKPFQYDLFYWDKWMGLIVTKGELTKKLYPLDQDNNIDKSILLSSNTLYPGDSYFTTNNKYTKTNGIIEFQNKQFSNSYIEQNLSITPRSFADLADIYSGFSTSQCGYEKIVWLLELDDQSEYACINLPYISDAELSSLNSQNLWTYPLLYNSFLIEPQIEKTIEFIKDEYILVAEGTVELNGIVKTKGQWVKSAGTKNLTINAIGINSVIGLFR